MIRLTRNFSLEEFVTSERHPELVEQPGPQEIVNLTRLAVRVLQPLRAEYGRIRVNSGLRSKALNAAIGGVLGSDHMLGLAADCAFLDAKNGAEWYKGVAIRAFALGARQVIWYPAERFIHIAVEAVDDNRTRGLLVSDDHKIYRSLG